MVEIILISLGKGYELSRRIHENVTAVGQRSGLISNRLDSFMKRVQHLPLAFSNGAKYIQRQNVGRSFPYGRDLSINEPFNTDNCEII
jgi:hypothetical protein